MSAFSTPSVEPAPASGGARPRKTPSASKPSGTRTPAFLTFAVVVLIVATAGIRLTGAAVTRDGSVVAAGLRGGDVVNVLVASPVLVAALLLAARGWYRAKLIWVGALAYVVYAYAYAVFVPTFNDTFLLYVALFTAALYALVFAMGRLPVDEIRAAFHPKTPARSIGAFWVVMAAVMTLAWGSASLQFAMTGDLPTDVLPYPEWRVHLGYVMDLAMAAPSAAIAGVLLWRRTAWGYALATALSVGMFGYQLNYAATAVSMGIAGVPNVSVSDPIPFVTATVFAIPMVVLLRSIAGRVPAPTD